jgi:hypothetical protein
LDEEGAHLFLKCKEIKKLWIQFGLEKVRERMCACIDAKEMIKEILNLEMDQRVLIVCMLWCWWRIRNKINAKESKGAGDSLVSQVQYWVSESAMHCKKVSVTGMPPTHSVNWTAPEGDVLKINVDGAFNPLTRNGGWGFVVRDCQGHVRGSGAGNLSYLLNPAQAEAEACANAIYAAAE